MSTRTLGLKREIVSAIFIGLVMVFFFVWLFAAALHQPAPHELRVGVVAPAMVVDRISSAAEANSPGTFLFSTYASAGEARAAVLGREVNGAVVIGSGDPLILVAGAGGEAASKAISGAFTAIATSLNKTATVEDVVPLPASDTRGLVPFFLVLGTSVSAFIFQIVMRSRSARFGLRETFAALLVFSVLDGVVAALAVGIVLGFDSGYWALAGVCALLALAVSSATAASCELFGRAGIGVAGLVLILLGNASSGSVVGGAFLPQPFRWLSLGLPAGSGLDAVKSVLYFGGEGAGRRLGTLAIWVAGSFAVLACLAGLRAWWRPRKAQPVEVAA
jgi:hypothetical protein